MATSPKMKAKLASKKFAGQRVLKAAHGNLAERIQSARAAQEGSGDFRTVAAAGRRLNPRLHALAHIPEYRRGQTSGSDMRAFSSFAGFVPRTMGGTLRRSRQGIHGDAGLTSGYSMYAPQR